MEMPQSRNDNPDNWNLDVGSGLVEHEEVEPEAPGKLDASQGLLAPIEACKFQRPRAPHGRFAVRQQLLDLGYEEGSIASPGDFVLERAFVET